MNKQTPEIKSKKPAIPRASNASVRGVPLRKKRFLQTGSLLSAELRDAMAKRGMVLSQLLMHWQEIVGGDIAALAQPERVQFAKENVSAVLVLFCFGANAPLVQMQSDLIVERVNEHLGYPAISRIQITQTSKDASAQARLAKASLASMSLANSNIAGSATVNGSATSGFSEETTPFGHRNAGKSKEKTAQEKTLMNSLSKVKNPELKAALKTLTKDFLSRRRKDSADLAKM